MTTSIIHLAVGLVLLVAVNIVLGGLNALFDGSFDKVKPPQRHHQGHHRGGLFHRLLHGRLAQPGHHRH